MALLAQVGAFADYKPGEGVSEAASSQQAEPEGASKDAQQPSEEPEPSGGGGGGGGDYPAHQVMGLPSLSPTMQQGGALTALWQSRPRMPGQHRDRSCDWTQCSSRASSSAVGPTKRA